MDESDSVNSHPQEEPQEDLDKQQVQELYRSALAVKNTALSLILITTEGERWKNGGIKMDEKADHIILRPHPLLQKQSPIRMKVKGMFVHEIQLNTGVSLDKKVPSFSVIIEGVTMNNQSVDAFTLSENGEWGVEIDDQTEDQEYEIKKELDNHTLETVGSALYMLSSALEQLLPGQSS